ncbi:hypothetical protein FQN60_006199 [Etheostoma spectabile]|uniref:Uncharacterized protein n=1 Tax=Etheostoma spectabile TaxID=54343 RepID=A0A5J5CKQ6_9PERO|nr:hypothetical protein FQN60_006199 [Etheostoma spectabile]
MGFHVLGRGFRGRGHPWLKKEMDCFADFPLLHCFNSQSHLPSRLGFAHKTERSEYHGQAFLGYV